MPVSPGVITSDSKPTESLYAAGTLWYNSDEAEGALYILYEDPAGPGANAGGKVWVQIAGGSGGGGGSVIVADTAPNAADEGDLWFDSESGRLYIWYVNANSQGQWVDASPEGPDETQVGDLKYDIANEDLQYWDGNAWVSIGGIGSSVTTEEPTDPSNGDLWWNTADNTLYIWYEDDDTGQWVISVPQGGEYVSKTDTASQNIVSDLTLGTDNKITLNATNGSAEFADGGVFNAYLISPYIVSSTATGNATYVGKNTTANTDEFQYVSGVGLNIGTNLASESTTRIKLSTNGSAQFAGTVDASVFKSTEGKIFRPGFGGLSITSQPVNGSAGTLCIVPSNESGILEANKVALGADSYPWFAIKATNTRTGSLILETELDNPANYVTTTEEYTETESYTGPLGNTLEREVTKIRDVSTYTGPTLDVKDRLQNLIARLDALEADEISDDAASNALLTLIASLTARVDARDAVIAELTTRIQTLEGGNN